MTRLLQEYAREMLCVRPIGSSETFSNLNTWLDARQHVAVDGIPVHETIRLPIMTEVSGARLCPVAYMLCV